MNKTYIGRKKKNCKELDCQERSLAANYCIIVLLIIISISMIQFSYGLGIAPSTKVIEYSAGEHVINGRIINNDHKDMRVMLYLQGELLNYATLDSTIIQVNASEAEKEFSYKVNLPTGLMPGARKLEVVALELAGDIDTEKIDAQKTMIFSTVMVIQQLKVNVPYPGDFAEGTLYISEGNVNDTITFTATIVNKGSETLNNVYGEAVIKGPTNEEMMRVKSNTLNSINAQESNKLVANWKAEVNPGVYYLEFLVNYNDKQIVLRKTFMIGNFYVDIKDVNVNNFRLGSIAKFDVDLLSRWNQPISNVYGDMSVLDPQGNIINTFRTAPIELRQLTTSTITGYWDTKDVKVGNYDVKVLVHYNDKSIEKLFKTVVGIDSIEVQDMASIGNVIASKGEGSSISLLFLLVAISIVLNIGLFVYFKFLRKKINNNNLSS